MLGHAFFPTKRPTNKQTNKNKLKLNNNVVKKIIEPKASKGLSTQCFTRRFSTILMKFKILQTIAFKMT